MCNNDIDNYFKQLSDVAYCSKYTDNMAGDNNSRLSINRKSCKNINPILMISSTILAESILISILVHLLIIG